MRKLLLLLALALPMVALAQQNDLNDIIRAKIIKNLALPREISLLSADQIADHRLDSIALSLQVTKKGNIDLTKSEFLNASVHTINYAFVRAFEGIRISRKLIKSDTLLVVSFVLDINPIGDLSKVYASSEVTYKAFRATTNAPLYKKQTKNGNLGQKSHVYIHPIGVNKTTLVGGGPAVDGYQGNDKLVVGESITLPQFKVTLKE